MRNQKGQFINGHKTPINIRRKISKTLYGRFRGSLNPNWKNGRHKDEKGYIRIIINPGSVRYDYEHRIVMEKIIGRKLRGTERVHHLNNIKDDNRPENLVFLPNEKAHRVFHVGYWKGKKLSKDHRKKLSISHKGIIPWNKGGSN